MFQPAPLACTTAALGLIYPSVSPDGNPERSLRLTRDLKLLVLPVCAQSLQRQRCDPDDN
jgi:hypothetical protein